jgi:hypothetical protein
LYNESNSNLKEFDEKWQKFCKIIDKNFKNKYVIDYQKNKFDILEIIHHKATPPSMLNQFWQLIIVNKNKISIKNCNCLFFDNLKILSKAKYKLIKQNAMSKMW